MMKENWTYKKLGEVCDVINGLWTGKKEPFINIAVIRNTNFSKDCKLKLNDVAYIDVEAKQFNTRKLFVGDIIIEKSGGSEKQPVGRAVLFDIPDGDYSFSNFTAALRIKNAVSVNPVFLHKCLYAYYTNGETLKMQSKTTGLHNLDMKAYLKLPIPVPPLETQSRIVSELDLLQSIIDKQQAQLKELDNLAQAIFYDMFGDPVENEKGWEVKKLENFCSKIGSGATPRGGNESYKTEGISLIRSLNVHNNEFVYKDLAFIDEEQAQLLSNVELQPNDILLNITGASVARCCIVPNHLLPARVNQHVCIIRPSKNVEVRYLSHLITSVQYQSFLIDLARGKAATREALPKSIVENLPIILPPLSLQQSFAAKIESIEKQKAAISQSIAETQKLFDYTMDKYFG